MAAARHRIAMILALVVVLPSLVVIDVFATHITGEQVPDLNEFVEKHGSPVSVTTLIYLDREIGGLDPEAPNPTQQHFMTTRFPTPSATTDPDEASTFRMGLSTGEGQPALLDPEVARFRLLVDDGDSAGGFDDNVGLLRSLNVTGTDAFRAVLYLTASPGAEDNVQITVRVCDLPNPKDNLDGPQECAAKGTKVGERKLTRDLSAAGPELPTGTTVDPVLVTIPVREGDPQSIWEFQRGHAIFIEILVAGRGADLGTGTEGGAGQWTVHYGSQRFPSRLSVSSLDAIRAAAFTTDREGRVTDVFRTDAEVKLVSVRFILKSAFGIHDITDETVGAQDGYYATDPVAMIRNASGGNIVIDPTGRVSQNVTGSPEAPDPALPNVTRVRLEEYDRIPADGVRAYRFADHATDPVWKYEGFGGTFTAVVEVRLRARDAGQAQDLRLEHAFRIAATGLRLDAWPGESVSHKVVRNQSSTFILNLSNEALVVDNIVLDGRITPSSWAFDIAAEGVRPGVPFHLGSRDSRLVQLTVRPPQDAPLNAQGIVTLTARGDVDAGNTKELALSVAIVDASQVEEAVGVIALNRTKGIARGGAASYQVLAWNKGADVDDLLLEAVRGRAEGSAEAQWTVTLTPDVVRGLAPGAVRAVALDVSSAANIDTGAFLDVDVKATSGTDTPPAAEALSGAIRTIIEVRRSIEVVLLKSANLGTSLERQALRIMEMDCGSAGPPDCSGREGLQDHANVTFARVWIKNTGDEAERYKLERILLQDSSGSDCASLAWSCEGTNWYERDLRGLLSRIDSGAVIDVEPGQQREFYLQIAKAHRSTDTDEQNDPNWDAGQFPENDLLADFQVTAQDEFEGTVPPKVTIQTKTLGRRSTSTTPGSPDNARVGAVLIEPVRRHEQYDDNNVIVRDAGAVTDNLLVRTVKPGENQTYKLRVTNGNSYDSVVQIRLVGLDTTAGWKAGVALEPERAFTAFDPLNTRKVLLSVPAGRHSYSDFELLVNLTAPDTVTAGEVESVFVEAIAVNQALTTGNEATDTIELRAVAASKVAVNLTAPRTTGFVHPGGRTVFSLNITNGGSAGETFTLNRTNPDADNREPRPGWGAVLSSQSIFIPAVKSKEVTLTITAPITAAPGDSERTRVEAKGTTDPTKTGVLELETQVVEKRNLEVTTPQPTKVVSVPEGSESADVVFELHITHNGNISNEAITADLSVASLPAGFQGFHSPSVTLQPDQTLQVPFTLRVPRTILQDSVYAATVRAVSRTEAQDFADISVQVTATGRPLVSLQAEKPTDLVDRGRSTRFQLGVRNEGTGPGEFPLEIVRLSKPDWAARLEDREGDLIDMVNVREQSTSFIFLNVSAGNVTKGDQISVTVNAFQPDQLSKASVTVIAKIHDYEVDMRVDDALKHAIPGERVIYRVLVNNTGNGNDTVVLSSDTGSLVGWTVDYELNTTAETLLIMENETREVLLVVQPSTSPLAPVGDNTILLRGSSVGALTIGDIREDTATLIVDVPDYRFQDVDNDGDMEIAVDRNEESRDGFEEFDEVFISGPRSLEGARVDADGDARIDFYVDTNRDGRSDVYWDPDDVILTKVLAAIDINRDGTQEFLTDTNGDGTGDRVYDPASRTLYGVIAVDVDGDGLKEYLIDSTGDSRPDWYYKIETDTLTVVTPAKGEKATVFAIDTDDDDRADKHYDVDSEKVSDARVAGLAEFAEQNWYFFVLFLVVLLIFAAVLARRRR